MSSTPFPATFYWGAATAGHQSEGNNSNSDTWFLENVSPTVFVEPSGLACNSYELWETDLDLLVDMGLNAYRFSVEWARIEPVEGTFDQAELDHYEAIVDGALQRGLAPIVTFSHFTAPHWFAKKGGWLDADSARVFGRFSAVVMERFGDRIAAAVTLNEPNLPPLLAWAGLPDHVYAAQAATLEAASLAAGVERYRAGNVVIPEDFAGMEAGLTAAHLAAKAAIKAARPELPVGLSIAIIDDIALPGGEDLRDRKRAEVYDHWLRLAQDDDFVGVQNYERNVFGPDGQIPPAEGEAVNEMGTAIEPLSLAGAVRYAHEVSGVPIFVTEHGMSTHDDSLRAAFIEPSIAGLADVIEGGVPVIGYCHWSLMDNYEWIFGYHGQLGLYAFDRETFERTAKPSASVYARVVADVAVHA